MPDLATFAMPTKLVVDEESASDTYSRFIAEPLEKGFGHTLGNSLRRVLLSSLEGVSVASIRIDGVPHEFTTIDGVIEDVTDVVLNFKQVRLECSGDLPRTLELRVDKAGEVTAADIMTDGVTKVLNPDQYICTIDRARDLYIELEINRGRGYCPAEENKREEQPIGVIPIDCLYSPIRRVAYDVHDCRVGQRTDYDRLELEVWTDGRIGPTDAIKQASQILLDHIGVFTGLDGGDDDDVMSLITSAEDEALLRKLLRNVNELELSVRAQNCLDNASIATIGELVQRPEAEMLKYRNFGQKSLNELKEKLVDLNLHLNMELKETVRIAFEKELEKQRAAEG
jgi:DNA-directed RNA polymerase subunit alpha